MTSFRPARYADLVSLAPRLREADVNEIQACSGQPPLQALCESYVRSEQTITAILDELPIAVFGIGKAPFPETGCIWMVGSNDVFKLGRELIRQGEFFINQFHQTYPTLWNMVDERNVRHLKWLNRMGFKQIGRVEKFGAESRPFIEVMHNV